MCHRENIKMDGRSWEAVVADLAEENPHAVKFLGGLREMDPEGFPGLCEALDDMNMRGVQIVIACDAIAARDLARLADYIRNRDQVMVDLVNQFMRGPLGIAVGEPKTVTSGARTGQRDML